MVLAFAAIYIIWGSTYVVVLFALKGFPPFLLGSLRYLIAGAMLFLWAVFQGEKKIEKQTVIKNAVVGLLTLVGGSFAVLWSEQYIPSGLAAIIVSAEPFWYVILDKRQWGYNFSNVFIMAGVLLGFAGILVLFGFNMSSRLSGIQFFCGLLLLLGCVSWVAGSLYSKYHPSKGSNETRVSIQLLVSGMALLISSFFTGEFNRFSFATVSVNAWLALLFLTIMGSVLTYNAYIWLLSKKPAVMVGTFAYVNPVVAVLLGAFLADERLQKNQLAALICILIGVLLTNLPNYATAKR